MVDTRWATTRVVTSSASFNPARISASTTGSTAAVASSRIKHARPANQRTSQRDALPLPTRERDAALAHHRVVLLRQREHELVGPGDTRRRADLVGVVRPLRG